MLFFFEKGYGQFCLFPLILDHCLEPLACAMRQNNNIHDFVYNPLEYKIILYANNISLFLSESQPSLLALMRMFNTLETCLAI